MKESPNLGDELKKLFGHSSFRGDQEAVVRYTLEGGSSLVLMPTGMGKSVCFQLPARLLPGLTVVLSPLIALMKDQTDQARKRGFRVAELNSSLSRERRESVLNGLRAQKYELLYVTPERFRQAEFREAVLSNKISLLAIDEAHCISQWGHDFRPDYSRVGEIRELLGCPVTMALTATATPPVREDILRQLSLPEAKIFDHGLERANLALSVLPVYGTDEKVRSIVALRHLNPGPMIVYCSLISSLQKMSRELQRLGLPHFDYHGSLPEKFRRRNQEGFLESAEGLMLATPAFGLGVDKSNIRCIVHTELPGSLEAYFQEVGRAGRDGQLSSCALLYDSDDVSIQTDFLKWANPEPDFYQALFNRLQDQPEKVKMGGLDYLRRELNFYNSRDYRLETALNMLERWGAIERGPQENDIRVVGELPEIAQSRSSHEQSLLQAQRRLLSLVQWVETENCRLLEIYHYFGYKKDEPCGLCDNCEKR